MLNIFHGNESVGLRVTDRYTFDLSRVSKMPPKEAQGLVLCLQTALWSNPEMTWPGGTGSPACHDFPRQVAVTALSA